jgi:predicted MFS family arabinose efflux permease
MKVIPASQNASPTGTIKNNRTFRRLLGASSVSMLGSHATTIAYPLLVLRLTGSPFTAGCVAFATNASGMIVYTPAGALVDRWNPRKAMLVSELGRAVAIAALAATMVLGKPIVALLIAVAVIEGGLEVFSGLAERRYLGSIVGRDQVRSALVRFEARTHVVLVAGRPLGGLLFEAGPIFPFLANVAAFIYSAYTLAVIKNGELICEPVASPREVTSQDSLLNDIWQGFIWIHKDKFVRMVIVSFSVGTLIFQALIMVFLSDAHDRHLPALAIGIVLAASGVGGALGSVAASRLLARASYSWIRIQTSIWVAGFFFLMLPAGGYFVVTFIIMAVLGFTGALGNIALDTHLMRKVDQEMLARVTSIGRLVSFAACAVGPVIGGVLAQELGVGSALFWLFISALLVLPTLSVFTPPMPRLQDELIVTEAQTRGRVDHEVVAERDRGRPFPPPTTAPRERGAARDELGSPRPGEQQDEGRPAPTAGSAPWKGSQPHPF